MLIQQNVDGSGFFNRSWAEYKVGFNDSRGNYWLGNERLHQLTRQDACNETQRLTNSGRYKLRVDVQHEHGQRVWYYAEYSSFVLFSEAMNYSLMVSGYSGNAGDAFAYHDRMMFSTYDRDNDESRANCAAHDGFGFWHNWCSRASVNGVRRPAPGASLRWFGTTGNMHLLSARMWLMC